MIWIGRFEIFAVVWLLFFGHTFSQKAKMVFQENFENGCAQPKTSKFLAYQPNRCYYISYLEQPDPYSVKVLCTNPLQYLIYNSTDCEGPPEDAEVFACDDPNLYRYACGLVDISNKDLYGVVQSDTAGCTHPNQPTIFWEGYCTAMGDKSYKIRKHTTGPYAMSITQWNGLMCYGDPLGKVEITIPETGEWSSCQTVFGNIYFVAHKIFDATQAPVQQPTKSPTFFTCFGRSQAQCTTGQAFTECTWYKPKPGIPACRGKTGCKPKDWCTFGKCKPSCQKAVSEHNCQEINGKCADI